MDENEELAILRTIAANPYDQGALGVYADWLHEHKRHEEEEQVRKLLIAKPPARTDVNSMVVGELIGLLLNMPLDAVVLYQACSDWCEMSPGDVGLVRAEDQKIIWRQQQGYSDYDHRWFETDEQAEERCRGEQGEYGRRFPGLLGRFIRPNNIYKAEKPDFRTVVTFPGN